jgi:hypothetical protein
MNLTSYVSRALFDFRVWPERTIAGGGTICFQLFSAERAGGQNNPRSSTGREEGAIAVRRDQSFFGDRGGWPGGGGREKGAMTVRRDRSFFADRREGAGGGWRYLTISGGVSRFGE